MRESSLFLEGVHILEVMLLMQMQATQEGLLQVQVHLLLCSWWNVDVAWEEPELLFGVISEKN